MEVIQVIKRPNNGFVAATVFPWFIAFDFFLWKWPCAQHFNFNFDYLFFKVLKKFIRRYVFRPSSLVPKSTNPTIGGVQDLSGVECYYSPSIQHSLQWKWILTSGLQWSQNLTTNFHESRTKSLLTIKDFTQMLYKSKRRFFHWIELEDLINGCFPIRPMRAWEILKIKYSLTYSVLLHLLHS